MHVAFVLPRFFPYRGGYENSLLALAKYLTGRGHQVTVFTTVADDLESFWLPERKTFPEGQVLVDGVTVRRFPISHNVMLRRASRVAGMLPNWRWKAQFARPAFFIPGLGQALREARADLIHIGPLPYSNLMYAGLRAAEESRTPLVATPCTHFGEEGNDDVARHYVQPHQIEMLRRCALVICMAESERRRLQQLGVQSEKTVIPHGIDFAGVTGGNPDYLREQYGLQGPVVLHLAVKTLEKGSITLLEAMKQLWAAGVQASLVMAGPAMSDFDRYLAANAPPSGVCFLNLPAFADQEKRDLLASATVVAQPSRVESLGLVMLEAWANARPVLAADIAVSRELVTESGGGAVVPFGDAQALAGEIARLLNDAGLRQALGENGRKLALRYDGSALWRRTAEAFESVAARRT